jgi:peptide deformylase
MVYPIVVYGSPILRKIAHEIDREYPKLDQIIADMFETMNVSDGVGLAAPQIGKSIRLIVIDASALSDDDASLEGFKKVFINPRIVEESGEPWPFTEGCLSLPNIREEITRLGTVRIQYYDEHFNYHDEIHDGIKARIIQHEYDHLEGVLLIDHISPLRKKLLKSKLNDIAKGKSDAKYKTRILK